jgi:hypothetical protein
MKTERVFYDLIYSEDDGGYYCEAYNKKGETLWSTKIHKSPSEAKLVMVNKYPGSMLIKEIL